MQNIFGDMMYVHGCVIPGFDDKTNGMGHDNLGQMASRLVKNQAKVILAQE